MLLKAFIIRYAKFQAKKKTAKAIKIFTKMAGAALLEPFDISSTYLVLEGLDHLPSYKMSLVFSRFMCFYVL